MARRRQSPTRGLDGTAGARVPRGVSMAPVALWGAEGSWVGRQTTEPALSRPAAAVQHAGVPS
jgi:hypothetical protein